MDRTAPQHWHFEDHLDWDNPVATMPDGSVLRTDRASLMALHGPEREWRERKAAQVYADELGKLGVNARPERAPAAGPAIDASKLPPLVSKREAADVLRCSERTINRLVATKQLRASRRSLAGSSRVLIDRASLLALLHSIRH